MLKSLFSTGLRALALGACLAGTAMADEATIVKAQTPKASPKTDKRIMESMTVDTKQLFGFTQADVQKADSEKLAKYLGPEIASVTTAQAPTDPNTFAEYTIDAGDILEFVSFDDTNLSREQVVVRYDGYVSLPRVPDIKLSGLTRPQAQDAVRKAYSKVFREPELSLSIVTPASKGYVVTGDVQNPGRYPFERTISLWDAINLAGGVRQRNNSSGNGGAVGITGQITKAFIIRRVNGERQVMPFDMRGLGKAGEYAGDVPITYNDVIYVPEGVSLVYLLGESREPVIVELTEGMTLLQMLALSGGYNSSTAKISSIVLLRQSSETTTDIHTINLREILKAKAPDMPLQPGDVIYIPQKTLVRIQEFVDRSVGSLSQILGLYTQAVDAAYALDLSRESLNALEDSNNVSVPVGGGGAVTTRAPRVLGTGRVR